MARRPTKLIRRTTPAQLSPELMKRIKNDPNGGLSKDILDYAFWRKEREPDDGLVAAMDKADQGDPEHIAQVLLNFDYDLPSLARYYLDNLIARGCVPTNLKKSELPPLSKAARSRLRAMLRPDRALSSAERRILADTIRRGIRRPKSAPPNVAYNKGLSEAMFLMAKERVRDYTSVHAKPRLTRAKAIEKVADELDLNFDTLSEYFEKGSGAMQRAEKHYENWLNGKSKTKSRIPAPK
jgi:hypothetical protein